MQSITQCSPRLIDISAVTQITSLKKTKLYELVKAGELRPIKLGRKVVFSEQEVWDWVHARISSRGK